LRTIRIAVAALIALLSPLAWTQEAGSLDSSFNPSIGGIPVTARLFVSTALQLPDERIFIGGNFEKVSDAIHSRVARLNADGIADPSVTEGTQSPYIRRAAVEADGAVVFGGEFGGLSRIAPSGAVTRVFSAGGFVSTVALQSDGKILFTGRALLSPQQSSHVLRISANGTLDPSFRITQTEEIPLGGIDCLAVQADGKTVVGGSFSSFGGFNRIARLNADGTLDTGFNKSNGVGLGGADGVVTCVAQQADGKILIGGYFTAVNGSARNRIARLNVDGTLDSSFTVSDYVRLDRSSAHVSSIALQADGKILVSGFFSSDDFTATSGVTCLVRLNPDGTRDESFNCNFVSGGSLDSSVASVSLQSDGRVLVSGNFRSVNGIPRSGIARLSNGPATQSLTVTDTTAVTWTRGGTSPEVSQVTFELSTDGGTTFTALAGTPTSVGTTGSWRLSGLSLPPTGRIRARGQTTNGFSTGLVEFASAFPDAITTLPPSLARPWAHAVSPNPVAVAFSLPETALDGSIELVFSNASITRTLVLANTADQQPFTFDPAAPIPNDAISGIVGGMNIPDGIYTVTLRYRDELGNPAASASRSNVTVDATAPSITIPAPHRAYEGLLLDYTQYADFSDATAVKATQSPAPRSPIVVGIQPVTITATDAAGNTSIETVDLDVRPVEPFHTTYLSKGDDAPGAGTNGLPTGASIEHFFQPAIDDAGNIAFRGRWTGGTALKGTGLYLNDKCLAVTGGNAQISGTKWTAFTDPVLDDGTIVTIAGLKGSVGSAVVSGSTSLDIVAKVGDVAPDVNGLQPIGGRRFKKFKAVAIRKGSVGIFAQLNGPTTSDLGLWIKDGNDPLKLALREGQSFEGKTIKSLITFSTGNDSSGHGRGWLTKKGSEGAVLALALFPDKTQAILSSHAGGDTSAISEASETFARFSIPAVNDIGTTTFLATRRVGGARSIVLKDGAGTEQELIRSGINTDFSHLSDPVISPNGGVAFTGLYAAAKPRTVCWIPAGQSLNLLAFAEHHAPGILDSQWKSFDSLAVTDRGPIFAATLVAGAGEVTKATAKGVWGTDFSGFLHKLFRTGDTIEGKKLAKFTLLKATVGNAGVTRSFNNDAKLVWIAHFSDSSSAIVRTEIP
jgi:uncharacterized delta-60 repeat protein